MGDAFVRKVIFLGQSGAGKSTILNVVHNGNVAPGSLDQPATTGNTAVGVTSEIHNFITDCGTFLTDTIGFDDNRFDPERLAWEMRRVVRASRAGFTHIILCLPLGRVSNGTRVYLAMLMKIFGTAYEDNLAMYFSRCEDGTEIGDIIEANKNDEDLGPLMQTLKSKEDRGTPRAPRMIAGTMICHRDQERERMCRRDRDVTYQRVRDFLSLDLAAVHPPRVCGKEMIEDFIRHVMRKIFRVKDTLQSVLASLSLTDEIKVHNHFPECSICLTNQYDDSKPAMQLACKHIFHLECLTAVVEEAPAPPNGLQLGACAGMLDMSCPNCRATVRYPGTALPN